MSSSSNSFLRGQRKSDLLELAETVGLEKYVQNLSLKLSRPVWNSFATRKLASRPTPRFSASPAGGAVALRPYGTAVLRVAPQCGRAPPLYAQPQAAYCSFQR